jgi:hypothetical protein
LPGGERRRTTGSSVPHAQAALRRSRDVEDWWWTFGLMSQSSRRHQSAPPADRRGETAGQLLQFLASVVPAMRAIMDTSEMWNGWRRTRRTRRDAHRRWGRTDAAGARGQRRRDGELAGSVLRGGALRATAVRAETAGRRAAAARGGLGTAVRGFGSLYRGVRGGARGGGGHGRLGRWALAGLASRAGAGAGWCGSSPRARPR